MKHVIFDFDGTLFNSLDGIFQSFVVAARLLDLPPPDKLTIASRIGPPIIKLATLVYPELSHERLLKFCSEFRHHYDLVGYLNSSPYDGIAELVQSLHYDQGIQSVSIVTNKPTLLAIKLLIKYKLNKYFGDVIGIDYPSLLGIGSHFLSKVDALNELLQTLDVTHNAPVYIGDTVDDFVSASSAGCKFIAVGYGFYEWQDHNLAPFKIAGTPPQLQFLISEL